ncbi:MAG: helix-turn-helix domain-containing protein [Kineosporiaceae bacterium]
MSTFSERLRRLRQQANLSQVQLAGEDLSPSYISLLESGKRQPSEDVATLLAERLGCAVEDLLTPAGEERRKQAALSLELAKLSLRDGQAHEARTRLEALVAEEGLDRALRDDATYELADAYEKCMDLERAIQVLLPLHERALNGTTHIPLPSVGLYLTHLYSLAGDLNAAVRVGEASVRLLNDQRATNTREYFRLASTLTDVYYQLGDVNQAKAYAMELGQIAQRHADPQSEAVLAWNAAIAAESQGKLDEALALCHRALGILSEHGSGLDVARLRYTAAWIILRHDPSQVAEARHLLELSRDALPVLAPAEAAIWQTNMALVHLIEGDFAEAERLARSVLLDLSMYPGTQRAETLLVLGDAQSAQSRAEEALERYVAVVHSLDGLPASRTTSGLWREVAERFGRFGRTDDAIDGYRSALDAVGIRSTEADVALAMETVRQRVHEADRVFAEPADAEDHTSADRSNRD